MTKAKNRTLRDAISFLENDNALLTEQIEVQKGVNNLQSKNSISWRKFSAIVGLLLCVSLYYSISITQKSIGLERKNEALIIQLNSKSK